MSMARRPGSQPRGPEPRDQEEDIGGAEREPEPQHQAALLLAGIVLILRGSDLRDPIYRPFRIEIYLQISRTSIPRRIGDLPGDTA